MSVYNINLIFFCMYAFFCFVKQIKPKQDPWQQKLLVKLKQWKKVDGLLWLQSMFLEVNKKHQVIMCSSCICSLCIWLVSTKLSQVFDEYLIYIGGKPRFNSKGIWSQAPCLNTLCLIPFLKASWPGAWHLNIRCREWQQYTGVIFNTYRCSLGIWWATVT